MLLKNIKSSRPELYEKSEHNIWLDPHIRKQMLTEHLNTESDVASRCLYYITSTVNFIDSHIPDKSELLDLVCGPGLLC